MYDPEARVYFKTQPTVERLCKYLLDNIPHDAKVAICGSSDIYIHLELDGSVVSLDDCSLSDMSDYDDSELREVS